MVIFNGTAKIRVVEARELRPTEWSKRLVLLSQNYQRHILPFYRFNHSEDPDSQMVDAYVNVDCDEYHIGKTVTRPRTKCPVWNEDYQVSRVD